MFISLICDHWLLHTWHKNFVSQSPSHCRAFRPIRISLKIASKRRGKSFFICPSAKEEDHCWWENTRFYWMDNFFLTEIRIPGNRLNNVMFINIFWLQLLSLYTWAAWLKFFRTICLVVVWHFSLNRFSLTNVDNNVFRSPWSVTTRNLIRHQDKSTTHIKSVFCIGP